MWVCRVRWVGEWAVSLYMDGVHVNGWAPRPPIYQGTAPIHIHGHRAHPYPYTWRPRIHGHPICGTGTRSCELFLWCAVLCRPNTIFCATAFGNVELGPNGFKSFCDPEKPHAAYPKLSGKGAEMKHLLPILRVLWSQYVRTSMKYEQIVLQVRLCAFSDGDGRFSRAQFFQFSRART